MMMMIMEQRDNAVHRGCVAILTVTAFNGLHTLVSFSH
jgi:hypothetical protein